MKSSDTEKLTPKIFKMSLNFEAETSCAPTPYYSQSLYALRVIVIVMCTASPRTTQHMRQHGKCESFGMAGRLGDRFFDEFSSNLRIWILMIFWGLGSSEFIKIHPLELWRASGLLLDRFWRLSKIIKKLMIFEPQNFNFEAVIFWHSRLARELSFCMRSSL